MEETDDIKIEKWISTIGQEKFLEITTAIESTLDLVEDIIENDQLLASLDGELVSLLAGILTKEEFKNNIEQEFSFHEIPKNQCTTITLLLGQLVEKYSSSGEKISNTSSGILDRFTQTKPILPSKREYGLEKTEPTQPAPRKFDPYHEPVDQK